MKDKELKQLLGQLVQQSEESVGPRRTLSLDVQVHNLLEKRKLLERTHGLQPGDFITNVQELQYCRWPTDDQVGLVIEVVPLERARRADRLPERQNTGVSHLIEDVLFVTQLDNNFTGYWIDGRTVKLHEAAMREAYGDDWREKRESTRFAFTVDDDGDYD